MEIILEHNAIAHPDGLKVDLGVCNWILFR